MRYAVVNKYFDSGKIAAYIKDVPDDFVAPEPEELQNHDEYVDVFDTLQEAIDFRNESRNA
jgi:hypothetical protein